MPQTRTKLKHDTDVLQHSTASFLPSEIRSNDTQQIAPLIIDTNSNEESFFVAGSRQTSMHLGVDGQTICLRFLC